MNSSLIVSEFKPSPSKKGKAFFILALLFLTSSGPKAQEKLPELGPIAFEPGERLEYRVEYEWKGLWTKVGKVAFTVKEREADDGTPCYRFQGKGSTLPFYDIFFKVRDLYRSLARKEDLMPLRFFRRVHEGKRRFAEDLRYEHQKGIIRYRSSKDEEKKVSFSGDLLDPLTAIYYCRSLKLDGLSPSDTVPVQLSLGKKTYSTYFAYKGKKAFQHPDGKTYQCHHIQPELIPGSIFKEGDHMKVLVTDDSQKTPVFVKSEIAVGTIKVYLSEKEGSADP